MSLRLKMIQMRMTEPDPSIWVRGPVGQRKSGGLQRLSFRTEGPPIRFQGSISLC
jgi:hypothetical protein